MYVCAWVCVCLSVCIHLCICIFTIVNNTIIYGIACFNNTSTSNLNLFNMIRSNYC